MLEQRSLLSQFTRFTGATVASLMVFSLYSIVDGLFVAKGVGEFAMAAVNLAVPFTNILFSIAVVFAVGANTIIAIYLGRGEGERADSLLSQNLALLAVIGVAISLLVLVFTVPFARLLGANETTLDYTVHYLRGLAPFALCFIVSYNMEILVKTDGYPRIAIATVVTGCLANCALDYLAIFVLNWGVWGAALATGLAQLGSLIFFLIYFLSGKSNLRFRRFRFRLKDFRRILPLGIADCSIELMLGFLTLLYNHVITQLLGESSLPIFAVIAYLSLVVSMVMQGIAQGMMPLVSLAVGENDRPSIRVYLRKALLSVLVIGVLVELFCQAAPGTIVSLLLSGDSALFDETVSALRQYALSYLPAGLTIVLAGYFAALGKAGASALLSLGRGFLLLPAALMVLYLLGASAMIWTAALIGELLSLGLGLFLLRRNEAAAKKELDT